MKTLKNQKLEKLIVDNTIKFYKDNLLANEKEIKIKEVVKSFFKSAEKDNECPFERSFLLFLSKEYGSFDVLSSDQWAAIYFAADKEKNTKQINLKKS